MAEPIDDRALMIKLIKFLACVFFIAFLLWISDWPYILWIKDLF
jgi:hypothetical protein